MLLVNKDLQTSLFLEVDVTMNGLWTGLIGPITRYGLQLFQVACRYFNLRLLDYESGIFTTLPQYTLLYCDSAITVAGPAHCISIHLFCY